MSRLPNFDINDKNLTIKKVRAEFDAQHNFNLRKTESVIKAASNGLNKNVVIEWLQKERQVTVDGVVAFAQPPKVFNGTFMPPFSNLEIS